MKIKLILQKHLLTIIGAIIGFIGGYLYWLYVGCESGSCPITSSPILSVIWGSVIGGLLFSMYKKKDTLK